jgi:two-component system chemotaxis sensor kinase CheA
LALFANECETHLHAISGCLGALTSGASEAQQAAAMVGIRASLHTLAGAARAVELLDLEYLCRALEALCAATPAAGLGVPERAMLVEALTLAPLLFAPTARLRNQMMALAARCNGAAARLRSVPA